MRLQRQQQLQQHRHNKEKTLPYIVRDRRLYRHNKRQHRRQPKRHTYIATNLMQNHDPRGSDRVHKQDRVRARPLCQLVRHNRSAPRVASPSATVSSLAVAVAAGTHLLALSVDRTGHRDKVCTVHLAVYHDQESSQEDRVAFSTQASPPHKDKEPIYSPQTSVNTRCALTPPTHNRLASQSPNEQ